MPSAVSAAVEKLVAIEKNRTVPESAVGRIAVGSQPLALTTTTVRSAGGAPAASQGLERGERVAQVGRDADVAQPELADPGDRRLVDVDRDDGAAVHRVARGRQRELAGVAGAEHADRAGVGRQLARQRAGAVDVVELEHGLERQVVGHRAPGRAVAHVGGAGDLDLGVVGSSLVSLVEAQRRERERGERDDPLPGSGGVP